MQVECRHCASVKAALSQLERLLTRIEGAAREGEALARGRRSQPGVGDFGNQADLRAATRLFGAEVGLQRLLLKTAHTAEKVQLVGREAQVGAVLTAHH